MSNTITVQCQYNGNEPIRIRVNKEKSSYKKGDVVDVELSKLERALKSGFEILSVHLKESGKKDKKTDDKKLTK